MHFNRFAVVHNRYEPVLSPAVAMLVANNGIKNAHTVIKGSGPKGRILKVCLYVSARVSSSSSAAR
jgi:pyruvate/2-oxoglutarate dehydrogenase complex dihydrolipoamide acyltransferase (E2) component